MHKAIPFFICSADLDDPDFQHFMKVDKDFAKKFGNGFIEDMFPILLKIRPTKKYREVMGIADELFAIIREKFKEHVETFDPGNKIRVINCLKNLLNALTAENRE